MAKILRLAAFWAAIFVVGLVVGACAAAPTPTATTKPAVAAPTPAKPAAPAPTPTKAEAIRFEKGKLQPLPDGFPKRTITIVTTKVGSSSDIDIRSIVNATEQFSPVPITVINDGEGHDQAFVYARQQVGFDDGYYLTSGSGSMMTYYYTRATGVGGKDFAAVILFSTSPIYLSVKADAPWKTLKDVVDYAKANPGKLRIVAGGAGTWNHTIAGWFAKEAGIEVTIFPEESSGAAVRVVLGGGAEVALTSIPALRAQVEAGKMRGLATAEPKRVPDLPDVPTYKEQGYDIDYSHFRAVLSSSKVPDQHLDWLFTLFKKGVDTPDYQAYLKKGGQYPLGMGGAKAKEYILKLDKVADEVTKAIGMQVEVKK